jgi:hypothetical protein
MAHTPRIEGRLTMILDQTRPRRALTRRVLIIALGFGVATLVPLAMLRPVARAQAVPQRFPSLMISVPILPNNPILLNVGHQKMLERELIRASSLQYRLHSVPPVDMEFRQGERDNPKGAVKHLRQIYVYLGIYRRTHGGAFPVTLGPNSLAADMAADPRRYGLPEQGADNGTQAAQEFDGPGYQRVIYFLHGKRPDGTLTGTAKRSGTRDMFAYTNYYVQNDARGKTYGFYLVLWDDGTVHLIPQNRTLTVPAYDVIGPPGATERARHEGEKQIAFPGQAGLSRG